MKCDFLAVKDQTLVFFSLVGCGILQRNVVCVTCILGGLSFACEYSVEIPARRVEVDNLKRKK